MKAIIKSIIKWSILLGLGILGFIGICKGNGFAIFWTLPLLIALYKKDEENLVRMEGKSNE